MPQLIVTVNIVARNELSGTETRTRDELDVWTQLPPGIQTALTQLVTRLSQVAEARYGADTVIEGMRLLQ